MVKLSATCLALLLLLAPAQHPPNDSELPSAADFPPQDYIVWTLEHEAAVARLAKQRFAAAPETVETVRLLADTKNHAGLLRAIRLIVDRRPQQIADAFEAAREAIWRFRGDTEQARLQAQTLTEIVAAARKRLPEFAREEAARIERSLRPLPAMRVGRQGVLREYPESPAAPEARYLLHRARLERALHLADMEEGGGDRQAAMKELEALVSEPQDFAIMAAQIARASLLWLQGDATASERVMREALTARLPQQRLSTPAAGLEEDIAEIRRVVFLPRGGSIYGFDGWNAFSWPVSPPPFALVNADVRVKLHDDEVLRVTLVQQLPAAGDVIFLNSEQIGLFKVMIRKLGGTRRRAPGSVMETPNQPVGDSMQILRLWNKFFPARPGHWGGWEFETYPVISEIHFTNPERTKAGARVTIGYSGATVELEKENGKWFAKRLTSKWIT